MDMEVLRNLVRDPYLYGAEVMERANAVLNAEVRYESDSADNWQGRLQRFLVDNEIPADERRTILASIRKEGIYRAEHQGGGASYTLTKVEGTR
jgi:hypothetical protein